MRDKDLYAKILGIESPWSVTEVDGVTNARSEGINAKIQWINYTARGFRNRERFRNAIYFHLGNLALYPEGIRR